MFKLENYVKHCPEPAPDTWHLEPEDIDAAVCTKCESPAWYDICRSELVCSHCGLVLQSPHNYVGHSRVIYPFNEVMKPEEPLDFQSHTGRLQYQIQWWRNWLNKNTPRIYPDDKRHFIPKKDKFSVD